MLTFYIILLQQIDSAASRLSAVKERAATLTAQHASHDAQVAALRQQVEALKKAETELAAEAATLRAAVAEANKPYHAQLAGVALAAAKDAKEECQKEMQDAKALAVAALARAEEESNRVAESIKRIEELQVGDAGAYDNWI